MPPPDRQPLLDPAEVGRLTARSAKRQLCGLTLGLVAMFATFGLVPLFHDPRACETPPLSVFAVIAAAFAAFIAGLVLSDHWAKRFRVRCPHCRVVIDPIVRATRSRRCPNCDRQVFPGRVRSDAVLRKYAAVSTLSALRGWCWTVAALASAAALGVVARRIGLPAFVSHPLRFAGVVLLTVGYAVPYVFVRTRSRQYATPTLLVIASYAVVGWDLYDRWPGR